MAYRSRSARELYSTDPQKIVEAQCKQSRRENKERVDRKSARGEKVDRWAKKLGL